MNWIRSKKTSQGKPFWGAFSGQSSKPIMSDYASNAMTIAPAGSGKGVSTVVPNILSITASKCIPDFKGELSCICKPILEARGEAVRVLNPFGLWDKQIGKLDHYNPLDVIIDDLMHRGGLRDVLDHLREMTMQLIKEPANAKGDDRYWRDGARSILGWCILLEAMVNEYDANLFHISLLIEDRQRLEDNLRYVLGIDLESKPLEDGPMQIEKTHWAALHDPRDVIEFATTFRARASNILSTMQENEKAFSSFITQAQNVLAPFSFGRLSQSMKRSTFKMSDLKDETKVTSLFIVVDASKPETSDAYLGLMMWCFLTSMKQHKAKHVPVYNILDEITNYTVHGLVELLTWSRGHGIKNHLIFQDFTAFEKRYGKDSIETLLSETEIKQILPGQRSPKTLSMIVKMLGEQSVMAASFSKQDYHKPLNESMSEAARPLMTEDEIRRTSFGILIIRQKRPALITPVPYAAIHPWRKQVGINPFHGKSFLLPVKLKVKS